MKYKVEEENGLYYIFKKKKVFFFWSKWVKVPEAGLGWRIKNMAFIKGCEHKRVAEWLMEEFYLKKEKHNEGA